jgi:transcriptional regulator with XRE-family HTH domain
MKKKSVAPDEAVPAGAGELRIGQKLKAARRSRRMSMRALADRVGCSESLISKIENDHVFPSLPTLHKLASELGTSIGRLFAGASAEGDFVSRAGQRPIISVDAIGRNGGVGIKLEGVGLNGELLYASIHVIDAGGSSGGFIQHVGEELAYVLEGQVEVAIGDKVYRLGQHDSIFFPSELPHGYRNPGDHVARILWVNTPPTF